MNARPSPQSIESEQAILGGIIGDPQRMDDVAALVSADDFYRPDHGRLFSLLRDMRLAGDVVDLISVADSITRGNAEHYGGLAYVLAMPDRVVSTANLSHYARTVRDYAKRRRLIVTLTEALDGAYTARTAGEVAASVLSAVGALDAAHGDSEWVTMDVAAAEAVAGIAEVREGRQDTQGMPLPWVDVAKVLPMMPRGELGIIAGGPGMGKSAAARAIAAGVAGYGYGVLVFSLEMSAAQLAGGIMAAYAHVSPAAVKQAHDRSAEDARRWREIQDAAQDVARLPVWVCAESSLTIRDVVARSMAGARQMDRRGIKIGAVVLDYIQLLDGTDSDNRATELDSIARQLKLLARSLDVPVIGLSGTNRSADKRKDDSKDPVMGDIEGSGGIARHAGWVMFPHRPSVYDDMAEASHARFVFVKNRYGPIGDVDMRWDGPTMTFSDPLNALRVIR